MDIFIDTQLLKHFAFIKYKRRDSFYQGAILYANLMCEWLNTTWVRFGRRLNSGPLWHPRLKCPLLAHGMTRFLRDLLDLCSPHRSGLPPQVIVHLCLVLFLTLFSVSVLNRETHNYSCLVLVCLPLPSVALTLTNGSPCVTPAWIFLSESWIRSSTNLAGLQIHMLLSLRWGQLHISSPKSCRAIWDTSLSMSHWLTYKWN